MRKKPHFSGRKKIVLIIAALLVVAGLVTTALEVTDRINLFGQEKKSDSKDSDGINYEPPTEQDAEDVEDNKEAIVNQQEAEQNQPNPPQQNSKKPVKPVIVRASNGEVSGYIPDIFENGGTCTAVFTDGSTEVTKTSTGFADATTTVCAPISYAGTAVQSGWKVTLRYDSNASQGASDAAQVN